MESRHLIIARIGNANSWQFVEFANEAKQPSTTPRHCEGKSPKQSILAILELKAICGLCTNPKGDSTDSLLVY